MSIATPTPHAGRPEPLRWTGDEFDRASDAGVFDRRRVELIEGELQEMPPMNDSHANAIQLAAYVLFRIFPPTSATVRVQLPMLIMEVSDNARV